MKKGFILLAIISVAVLYMGNPSNAQVIKEDVIIGEHIRLYSETLKEERSVLIHLPTGYEKSQEKYPVLYVLDGGSVPRFSIVSGTVEKIGEKTLAVKHIEKALDILPTWVSAKKKLEELKKK
jgi:enterochelin esterase-like enzyme